MTKGPERREAGHRLAQQHADTSRGCRSERQSPIDERPARANRREPAVRPGTAHLPHVGDRRLTGPWPKPCDEPSEIDPEKLAAAIHDRLERALVPLGFARHEDEWRRDGEVPQTLNLQTGLTSRTEVKFFLQATLRAEPLGVAMHLPKLPARMGELHEQGYVFRSGDSEEALCAAVLEDFSRYVEPLFQRFTSASEVRRGFEDRTFHPHLKVGDRAVLF